MLSKRTFASLSTLLIIAAATVLTPTLEAGRAGDVRMEAFELLNQGVTAYRKGDYSVAVDKLQRSAGMALNSFRAHYYLGLALNGDRRYAEAIEALTVALDLDPNHVQSLIAMGDARLKQGDLEEARAEYFRGLKLRPEYPAALDGLARIYEARADEEEAIRHYQRAIASDTGFAPAYTHLGDLYLANDRFEEAVMLLEEAVSVRPDFGPGLNRLAIAYGRLGLDNQAVATIQKAMELEPKVAQHPATLGVLQLGQDFVTTAEKWFRRALELDPNLPEARMGLAEVARRRGDYPGALAEVATALEDPRLDAAMILRLEELRTALEVEERDVAALEERVETEAEQPGDPARLARIYAGRGQWDEAIALQTEVGSSPEQEEALAYMLFRGGRFREAQQVYAELAGGASRVELEVNNGVSLALLGDDDAAVEAYRRALAIDEGHRSARLYLGNALLRLGRREPAVEAYRTFLDQGRKGEAAERVRRILTQIAPEALPAEPASPLEQEPQPPDGASGGDAEEGAES